MDKDRLPRWGWLLLGLFGMSIVANVANVALLGPLGLPEDYYVVTVIAAMTPVLIYVGVWLDEDRQYYWDYSPVRIVGDLLFIFLGAAVGAASILVMLIDTGLHTLVRDILSMAAGFLLGWGLFWWRNPEMYRSGNT